MPGNIRRAQKIPTFPPPPDAGWWGEFLVDRGGIARWQMGEKKRDWYKTGILLLEEANYNGTLKYCTSSTL